LTQAGAWTPKSGAAYHKLAAYHFSSDRSFGARAPDLRSYSDTNLTYYFEYGLTDRLTFVSSIPYKRLSSERSSGTVRSTGIGDIDLGLRYRLLQDGPLVLSTSWLLKAPYAYSSNAALPPGNGQVDFEGRLLFGYGLGSNGYFGAELGYRYRAEAPADELRYLVEYGFDATESLYLRAKYDGIVGQGNSSGLGIVAANPNLNLEFDLTKLEVTAGLKLTPSSAAEVSVTRNITGENTLRGSNYSLAWVYSF
jgi:protein XagA